MSGKNITIDSITKLKILACPFCGGKATVDAHPGGWGETSYSVGCGNRDEDACPGYQSITTFARRSDAIAAWNRRTPNKE